MTHLFRYRTADYPQTAPSDYGWLPSPPRTWRETEEDRSRPPLRFHGSRTDSAGPTHNCNPPRPHAANGSPQ